MDWNVLLRYSLPWSDLTVEIEKDPSSIKSVNDL